MQTETENAGYWWLELNPSEDGFPQKPQPTGLAEELVKELSLCGLGRCAYIDTFVHQFSCNDRAPWLSFNGKVLAGLYAFTHRITGVSIANCEDGYYPIWAYMLRMQVDIMIKKEIARMVREKIRDTGIEFDVPPCWIIRRKVDRHEGDCYCVVPVSIREYLEEYY